MQVVFGGGRLKVRGRGRWGEDGPYVGSKQKLGAKGGGKRRRGNYRE